MSDDLFGYDVEVSPVADSEGTAQHSVATERRKEERTSTKLTCAVVREAGLFKSKQLRPVRVLDISPGGLGFESPVEYEPGQRLYLVVDTPVKIGIQAAGEVRYVVRLGANYRIGVKFTDISPADRRLLHRRTFLDLLNKKGGRTP